MVANSTGIGAGDGLSPTRWAVLRDVEGTRLREEGIVASRSSTVEPVESAPFGQNAFVLWHADRDDLIVVDPGFDTPAILRLIEGTGRRVAAVLNTHGHVDHIAGNAALKQAHPDASLIIGRNDAGLLSDPDANLSGPFGVPLTSPDADRLVDHGEALEVAGFPFEVREIPGHSPGSVVFVSETIDPAFVLGGDVLFAGSIGRTDLGGDYHLLMSGIVSKLLDLPDTTIVYPGHGPATTIGRERRSNPFILEFAGRAAAR